MTFDEYLTANNSVQIGLDGQVWFNGEKLTREETFSYLISINRHHENMRMIAYRLSKAADKTI